MPAKRPVFYSRAAEQGLALAQYNLATLYELGKGVGKDEAQAFELYAAAAAAGDVDAMVNLGLMYLEGRGTGQDYALALQWTEQAATQSNAIAYNNLGHMYEHGLGVAKDLEQALHYYRLSADLMYPLGADNHARLSAAMETPDAPAPEGKPLTAPYPPSKLDA